MSRMARNLLILLIGSIAAFSAALAHAHSFAPVSIRVVESADHAVTVVVRSDVGDAALPPIEPELPDFCSVSEPPATTQRELERIQTTRYECSESLAGNRVVLPVTDTARRHIVLSAELADGTEIRQILQRGESSFLLSADDGSGSAHTPSGIAPYLWIGVEHIWFGFDHILFVLCLVVLIRAPRKLFWTITTFTLAHSVTLGLAALGLVHVPGPPVEAAIALSIVLLAVEAIRHESGVASLTSENPWLIALFFGLIHGLGFAGALSDIGLPEDQEIGALALFNLGVELGQIAFVLLVVALGALARKLAAGINQPARLSTAWVSGIIASFWLVERVAGFYGL
jgi:hydrogenase/urease accessory protein HupE